MSRLIDADKLTKELNKFVGYDDDGEQCFLLDTKLSTDEVFITIGEQLTVKTSQWVSCSERLPETDEKYKGLHIINVLVTTDKGKVTKVQRIHGKNYDGHYDEWYWGRVFGKMKAWQHLPEPYKVADSK